MAEPASYSSGEKSKPLIEKTVGDIFDETAARYPDNVALVSRHEDLRLTYSELKKKIDDLAISLLGFGVQKGDRVGIWSPNNFAWVATQFATAKIGAILVNINPAYRVQELEYRTRPIRSKSPHNCEAIQNIRLSLHDLRAGTGTPRINKS